MSDVALSDRLLSQINICILFCKKKNTLYPIVLPKISRSSAMSLSALFFSWKPYTQHQNITEEKECLHFGSRLWDNMMPSPSRWDFDLLHPNVRLLLSCVGLLPWVSFNQHKYRLAWNRYIYIFCIVVPKTHAGTKYASSGLLGLHKYDILHQILSLNGMFLFWPVCSNVLAELGCLGVCVLWKLWRWRWVSVLLCLKASASNLMPFWLPSKVYQINIAISWFASKWPL